MATKNTLERALRDLEAAKERYALRQKNAEENSLRELTEKLKNFDLYVESVLEAKTLKILQAKTERKKNRIRDELIHTEAHYKEQRKQMVIKAHAKAYKKPLYLIAAEEKVKALSRDGGNTNSAPVLDERSGSCDQERGGAEPEPVLAT